MAADRTKRLLLQGVTSRRVKENLNTKRLFNIWAQYNSSDMTATQLMEKLNNLAIIT